MQHVKTFLKRSVGNRVTAILDQMRTWGVVLPRASGADDGPVIRVYEADRQGNLRLVGALSQDRGAFVFRYDAAFASSSGAEPISAFPDFHETYRSQELWPFFAVRIPPLRRADVKQLLERRGLREDQTLEVLGTLARKSATNPYELHLEKRPDTQQRKDPPMSSAPPTPAHSAP